MSVYIKYIATIVYLLGGIEAAQARDCRFEKLCVNQGSCSEVEFNTSYEHTGYDEGRQHQTASMNLKTMPWLSHEEWQEPRSVRGYLAEADVGERTYAFEGPNANMLLSVIGGSAIFTVHVTNVVLEPPIIKDIKVYSYFGDCE